MNLLSILYGFLATFISHVLFIFLHVITVVGLTYCPKLILRRLLCPDIVQFHCACFRSEIFLRELTFLKALDSNPKSSHSADPQFSYKLPFVLTNFVTNLNKRPFFSNHIELICSLMRVGRNVNNIILSTTLRRHR